MSLLPETMKRPSGEKPTDERTELSWPAFGGEPFGGDATVEAPSNFGRVASQVPDSMECARPSGEKNAVTIHPLGEKATADTSPGSSAFFSSAPLAASQSLRVWSSLPETMKRPSWEKATEDTKPVGPLKVFAARRSRRPIA